MPPTRLRVVETPDEASAMQGLCGTSRGELQELPQGVQIIAEAMPRLGAGRASAGAGALERRPDAMHVSPSGSSATCR